MVDGRSIGWLIMMIYSDALIVLVNKWFTILR